MNFSIFVIVYALFIMELAAQTMLSPMEQAEAALAQLSTKLQAESVAARQKVGISSKQNFKSLAGLWVKTAMQLKSLTNSAKTAEDPSLDQCVEKVNVANTNVKNMLMGAQLCGVTSIQSAKNYSNEIISLKNRVDSILSDCQLMFPSETQDMEVLNCSLGEIKSIETLLLMKKQAAAQDDFVECKTKYAENIDSAILDAQKDFTNCVATIVVM